MPIRILGVNAVDLEIANEEFCTGRTLPWLQDTQTDMVWASWGVAYRDVVILDDKNQLVGVYNLTTYDLADDVNYAELKTILVETAGD